MQLLNISFTDVTDLKTALLNMANEIDMGKYDNSKQIAFIVYCRKTASYGLMGSTDKTISDYNLLKEIAKSSLCISGNIPSCNF